MELLLSSIDLLVRWDVILALLVGSIGGVIIGAIPGVGRQLPSRFCCLQHLQWNQLLD